MSAVLVLSGAALLVLPGVVAAWARCLRPDEWRWLNRVTFRLGFAMIATGFVLAAVPTVADAAGVDPLAELCHHLLGPMARGGGLAALAILVAGVAFLTVAGIAWRRARRLQHTARIDRWYGEHTRLPDASLVVLPTAAVVAYATPGSPAQVVVSRGLTRALSPDELAAVVRHELAHLRHGHHRDLVLAGVVDATLGWLPGVRASTAALRLSIERSADEVAAERPGARDATRRALIKATETMLGSVPAFTAALTLVARLDALATSPPDPSLRQRAVAFAPLATVGAVTVAGLVACMMLAPHSVLHLMHECQHFAGS